MPEPTETFAEKVILLLIDKVAIGALIGLAWFCASIFLERLKTTLSFRSEVDKVRVQKMGELWNIFGKIHTHLAAADAARARIVKEESESLDSKLKIAAGEIPEKAKNRIISEAKPRLEQGTQELEKAWPVLEAARYWLGSGPYAMHVEHLKALTEYSGALTKMQQSQKLDDVIEKLRAALKASQTRLDIKQLERAL